MLASLFWTIAGLVLAGGGVWTASLFVPSVALALKAMLDFVRSPIGTVAAAVVAGFVLFSAAWVAGDMHGTSSTKAAWREADAQADRDARARDEKIKTDMAVHADQAIATDDQEAKSLAEKEKKYESENPDRPGCRATRDDIRRLRAIQ